MADPRILDQAVKPAQHVSPQQVAAVAASAHKTPFSINESKRPSLKKDPSYTSRSHRSSSSNSLTTQQTSAAADHRKAEALKRHFKQQGEALPVAVAADDDPTALLPSAPPQIYLNLLILEASLRAQYLTLLSRRRQHTFFLLLLSIYVGLLTYAVFLRPREDGQGYGGSPYWAVDAAQKIGLLGGVITGGLVWGTGVWERGVRWPRRWIGVTNRGLRVCNLKVVVVRGRWWRRLLSALGMIFPVRALFGGESRSGSRFAVIDLGIGDKQKSSEKSRLLDGGESGFHYRDGYHRRPNLHEEDVARGGDTIKVLLLPKHFSPEFRENWELYRNEYWDRENERRAELRKTVKAREKEEARKLGGWRWWFGVYGGSHATLVGSAPVSRKGTPEMRQMQGFSGSDVEKGHHISRPSKDGRKRRTSNLSDSHSRSSSRSSVGGRETPDPETGRRRTQRPRPSSMLMTTTTPAGDAEASAEDTRKPKPSSRQSSVRASPIKNEPNIKVEEPDELDPTSDNASLHNLQASSSDPRNLSPGRSLHKRRSTLSNSSTDGDADDNESITSERSTTSSNGAKSEK